MAWDATLVRPYESLWSLVNRFAFLHRPAWHSLSADLRWGHSFGIFQSLVERPADPKKLSAWLNRHRGAAELLQLSKSALLRSCLPTWDFEESYPELRFCSQCLREAFHSPVFQWVGLDRCPLHQLRLRTGCPHCGHQINTIWTRQMLLTPFGCGDCRRLPFASWQAVLESRPHATSPGLGFYYRQATHRILRRCAIYVSQPESELSAQNASVLFRIRRGTVVSQSLSISRRLIAVGEGRHWVSGGTPASTEQTRYRIAAIVKSYRRFLERSLLRDNGLLGPARKYLNGLKRYDELPFVPSEPARLTMRVHLYQLLLFALTIGPRARDARLEGGPLVRTRTRPCALAAEPILRIVEQAWRRDVARLDAATEGWLFDHLVAAHLQQIAREARVLARMYATCRQVPYDGDGPPLGVLGAKLIYAVQLKSGRVYLYGDGYPTARELETTLRETLVQSKAMRRELRRMTSFLDALRAGNSEL